MTPKRTEDGGECWTTVGSVMATLDNTLLAAWWQILNQSLSTLPIAVLRTLHTVLRTLHTVSRKLYTGVSHTQINTPPRSRGEVDTETRTQM